MSLQQNCQHVYVLYFVIIAFKELPLSSDVGPLIMNTSTLICFLVKRGLKYF
jgi:hypothetical protein